MQEAKNALCQFVERRIHIEQLRHTKTLNVRDQVKPAKGASQGESDDQDDDDDRRVVLSGRMPMPMLKASIKALGGLLHPLIVVPMEGDLYAVAAGGRRLKALQELHAAGELADPLIYVREVASGDAVLISLVENVAREPMHAADECVAFARMLADGFTVEAISAHFAMSARDVHKRIVLAKLHPQLLAEFKAGKMSMDTACAFTVEMDHKRQMEVWKKLPPYSRSAYSVREALTHQDLTADSRLVRLVGLDAYKSAGGQVNEDLFAPENDPRRFILTDPGLIDTLVAAMLNERAEELRAEGWAWVELLTDTSPYSHAHSHKLEKIARSSAKKADCGWYVYVTHDARLEVDGPYMSAAAVRAKQKAAMRGADDSGEGEGEAIERVPETLMRSLTAHKSAALQCALLGNPRVTMAVLAANLMGERGYQQSAMHVSIQRQDHEIANQARGYEGSRAAVELQAADKAWDERIGEADALAFFLEQDLSVSLEAIAYATARSFSIISSREGAPEAIEPICKALDFKLPEYFKPTADTYLNHVPKKVLVHAVTQAVSAEAAAPIGGMKKGDAVAAAEAKLEGTGWVPEAIR